MEARHRVLRLLVRSPDIETQGAMKLNHLRRRAERWIDMLVGHLLPLGDVTEFAIDAKRAADFAEDFDYQSRRKGGRQMWPLLQAALRTAFRRGIAPGQPERRPQRPDRLGHCLLFSRRAVRVERASSARSGCTAWRTSPATWRA